MYARTVRRVVYLAVSVCLLTLPRAARAQDAEVVIEWNRILQSAAAVPGALPPTIFFTRPYAILHVAMFDALNSIDYLYTPYASRVTAPAGASREAAAAQAGHDVLVAMLPSQAATFDAALASQLSRLPSEAVQLGASIGAAAAREILDRRADDGWNRVPPPYILPDLPGYYQVTPPQNAPAGLTHYPDIHGFVISDFRQFLVEPPPALTSEQYAADFNEVKALGGTTSRIRTDEHTLIARIFAPVGYSTSIPGLWSNVARDVARAHGLSGLDTARLFALLHITFHDGLKVTISNKYLYGFWRPVTAIRAADRDGNEATEADPTWSTLIPTPPYPAYPGNMACIGGSGSRVFARVFGRDDVSFTATWVGINQPNVTRAYNGFRQLGDEAARSRIYGGIHYTFDTTSSMGVCTQLADYVFDNVLRARFQ